MRVVRAPAHQTEAFDRRIGRIADRQHGIFTREQASAAGATRAAMEWRVRVGRWERVQPRIYRLAGSPRTWRQKVLAICWRLGEAAVVSHRTAAFLRRTPGFRGDPIEISVPRNRDRRRLEGVRLRSVREPLSPEDVTTLDAIPVTTPARTLLDLSVVESEHVVERVLDDALRRRLVTLGVLDRWLDDARRRRHRGRRSLRRLVDVRLARGVTDSPLEDDLLRLLERAGLPTPILQHEVRVGDRFVARPDFAYPEQRVAIEADSFSYHGDRRSFDHDRARFNDLQALGWLVLGVTSKHLEEDPDGVAAWVREALNRYP